MASAPPESLCPPLTAALIRREAVGEEWIARRPPMPSDSQLAANAKLFTMTWAGGFVFFLTFIA